jgi:hypothetical protein
LREEGRIRVFENGLLRRIFGPKSNKETGELKNLHIEKLNDLSTSPNIFSSDQIEKNELGGACSTYGGQ